MRILVDADACPVLNIIENLAEKYDLDLIIFSDIYHNLTSEYGNIIKMDKKDQSVDMAIYNQTQKEDIVVTQDYGLAAMVLSKKCKVLNNKGKIFTDDNIDYLLMRRHQNSKLRRAGKKHPNPKKRKEKDDIEFEKYLKKVIEDNMKLEE